MDKLNKYDWKQNTNDINQIEKGVEDDLFISCLSYEPRTLGIIKALPEDYKSKKGIFIINNKFRDVDVVKKKINKSKKIINDKNLFDNSDKIFTSIDNPIKIIVELNKIIKKDFENKNINVTLDITTIPRGQLLTILYYLRNLSKLNRLRCLYVSAEDYSREWLSKGYKQSIIPPFFEGPSNFEKKHILVILTGFEVDRPVNLIDYLEPSKLILLRPSPGTADKFFDKSTEISNEIKNRRKVDSEIFEIPGDDPFKFRKRFFDYLNKYEEKYNFYISPLGTKLETVGLYLAYEERQIFRIIYPIPLAYNINEYSKGCRDIYEII